MAITTRGRYGLKAMLELALHEADGPLPLRRIAAMQDLPEHYLEQLMAPLRKAGLVRSVRGAQGGYLLAREPERITVGEVLRVLDGPPVAVSAANGADPDDGALSTVWARIREAVERVVDAITLADLVAEERARRERRRPTYYI